MTRTLSMTSIRLGALLAASSLAIPAAGAHIVLAQPSTAAGSYYAGYFRVGHGCDASPTVKLRIQIPADIHTARAQPKPGWTVSVEREKLPAPVNVEGHEETERVSAIAWSGRLEADQFDEFGILMKLPDGAAGDLYFPAVQTCEQGSREWTGIPAKGQAWHDLPAPAPVLRVAAAEGAPAPATVGVGALSIAGATIPEAPGGNGAAYLTITNDGRESDWVTKASSDVSAAVEFHTMEMVDGTMQMRPMGDVVIPPGASMTFQPGGDHLMLIGLTRPLRVGDVVTLKLTFDRHGEITVPVTVTPRQAKSEGHDHH